MLGTYWAEQLFLVIVVLTIILLGFMDLLRKKERKSKNNSQMGENEYKMREIRKLQEIPRKNSNIPSLYLPKDMVELLRWKKGDDIDIQLEGKTISLKKSQ